MVIIRHRQDQPNPRIRAFDFLELVDISAQMEQIYSVLSDVSHVRRSGLRGMVSVPLRRAVYRAHPDQVARAHATVSTVPAVEATVLGVGDALAAFFGDRSYAQIIKADPGRPDGIGGAANRAYRLAPLRLRHSAGARGGPWPTPTAAVNAALARSAP